MLMMKKKPIMKSLLGEEKPSKFDRIRRALLEYKAVYGDLLVPNRYVVPTNDTRYSDDNEGMKLGSVVFTIRMRNAYKEHKEELLAMGFDYNSQVRDFEEVKVALLAYKEIYGNLLVPNKYIVPINDIKYPKEVRGMSLGITVNNIRNKNAYKGHKEELLAMGFDFHSEVREFQEVKVALLSYNNTYGNLLVPVDYIIPYDDTRYPESVRGMRLGHSVIGIRAFDIYKEHKEELLAIGFDYDKQVGDFDLLLEALLVYELIHGDLEVSYDFVIEEDDERYSEQVRKRHGNLGSRVYSIQRIDSYAQYREELLAIGISFTFKPVPFPVFKEALETYKKLHGDCYVPSRYDNREDTNYPEEMRGRALGNIVDSIRSNNHYKAHREELLAMGFDYKKRVREFQEVKVALLAYKEIYGDLLVPKEYIIPINDTKYPENVRGMKLGSTVSSIRNANWYKEHKQALLAMGFDYDKQVLRKFKEVKEPW